MSQQITEVGAVKFEGAKGINDSTSSTKLPKGFASLATNFLATGDVWPRRHGREEYGIVVDGDPVISILFLTFEGAGFRIAQVGDSLYNLEP